MAGADLLYGGTEGSSGSDASHERAEREATDGTASARQAAILAVLRVAGDRGLTWKEVADLRGLHHGQATGALSNMHKAGTIARLQERRGRCSIYVLPEFVGGRRTAAQGRREPETVPTGFPYRLGDHLILGPDVSVTLDGESLTWKGRRFHPVDSHDPHRAAVPVDSGRRPLFDL